MRSPEKRDTEGFCDGEGPGGESCMKLWGAVSPGLVYKGDIGHAWRSVQVGTVGVSV